MELRISITLSEGYLGIPRARTAGRSGVLKNFREGGRVGAGRPTDGEASPAKDSRSNGTGYRSAQEGACTKASAGKDANPRSGSECSDG